MRYRRTTLRRNPIFGKLDSDLIRGIAQYIPGSPMHLYFGNSLLAYNSAIFSYLITIKRGLILSRIAYLNPLRKVRTLPLGL